VSVRGKSEHGHAVPPYEELQLRLDGFGEFFVADQTLNFFHDFPVAGDEEARGIARRAAELVGGTSVRLPMTMG